MTITLRDLLNDGKVHVLDGAMGTMLYSKGFFLNVCYDELNLKQPKLVQEVHAAYVRAGAEILETNTFGANPVKLGSFGLADDTEKINQAAAELARAASGGQTSVVGAIGPLGVRIEPFGALAREEAFAHFQRQVTGLVAGGRGVDGFILETFSDVDELHEALRAVRSLSDLPVIAQMTIGDDGLTHYGTAPETFAQQLAEWGADVIGVNCSVGPAGVLEAVEKMVKVTDRRSEEHTSELQSRLHLVCRLLLEKKKKTQTGHQHWRCLRHHGARDARQAQPPAHRTGRNARQPTARGMRVTGRNVDLALLVQVCR